MIRNEIQKAAADGAYKNQDGHQSEKIGKKIRTKIKDRY